MSVALVLGGAGCLWGDLDALEAMVGRWRWPVFAVNDVACKRDVRSGRCWERRIDHFCTLHAEKVSVWRRQRRELVASLGRSPEWDVYETWSCTKREPIDHHFTGITGGSSGLYAVSVALHLGYERVVLAGVPMDANPNAFRDEELWKHFRRYRVAWERDWPRLRKHVRSMSGWTRTHLGAPTPDWVPARSVA